MILKKLPCQWRECGQEVLANPDVVFGPYHRECWTKFLSEWVENQKAKKEGARS